MTKEESAPKQEKTFVIFRLSIEEFAIDISCVYELIKMQEIFPLPQAPPFLEGVVRLRNRIIAAIDLARKFGLSQGISEDAGKRIIICRVGKFIIGLIVAHVSEVASLPNLAFTPAPQIFSISATNIPISGIVRLGERVIPVLDLEKILTEEESGLLKSAA
jgi:purine-binding chemotaxis protein CheW